MLYIFIDLIYKQKYLKREHHRFQKETCGRKIIIVNIYPAQKFSFLSISPWFLEAKNSS